MEWFYIFYLSAKSCLYNSVFSFFFELFGNRVLHTNPPQIFIFICLSITFSSNLFLLRMRSNHSAFLRRNVLNINKFLSTLASTSSFTLFLYCYFFYYCPSSHSDAIRPFFFPLPRVSMFLRLQTLRFCLIVGNNNLSFISCLIYFYL